jgi:hypothetical protein
MSTDGNGMFRDLKTERRVRTCSHCDAEATAYVHLQARDGRKVIEWDGDVCDVHMVEVERDVDDGEAYVLEHIEYAEHGFSWSVAS